MRSPLRLRTLIEPDRGDQPFRLPENLRERYGGDLRFPAPKGRPYTFANFVSTLDGVVTYGLPGRSGGGDISGQDSGDRFIMALLRASADAVMVGARTLQEVPGKVLWLPEQTDREGAERLHAYRSQALGIDRPPLLVVVSGSGEVDLNRAVFSTPGMAAVIFTSAAGEARLVHNGVSGKSSVVVHALPSGQMGLAPEAMLHVLQTQHQVRHLLLEGGPALLGEFLRLGLLDEMFLTLAPQIAGRDLRPASPAGISGAEGAGPDLQTRLPLVSTTAFQPGDAPWCQLLSAKSREAFLYLRYRLLPVADSEHKPGSSRRPDPPAPPNVSYPRRARSAKPAASEPPPTIH